MRYLIFIRFKPWVNGVYKFVPPLAERCKTMKEVEQYKALLDDSVEAAFVEDTVNGALIYWR